MKPAKLFFILSLTGILILLLLANSPKPKTATIKFISSSNNKIEIITEEFNETLILFNTNFINLSQGDKISFIGKPSEYKSVKQIIVEKIEKIN